NNDGTIDCVGATYTPGVWTHFTLVHTGGILYLYKNGVLVSSTASGNTSSLTGNIRFGRGTLAVFYQGAIDALKIFNYGRSAAQVAYDYNRGGPVAWWKFDECQGST